MKHDRYQPLFSEEAYLKRKYGYDTIQILKDIFGAQLKDETEFRAFIRWMEHNFDSITARNFKEFQNTAEVQNIVNRFRKTRPMEEEGLTSTNIGQTPEHPVKKKAVAHLDDEDDDEDEIKFVSPEGIVKRYM